MKYGLILSLLISVPCIGQIKATGEAKTAGPCSPAISGNNNRVIMNCQGNGKEKVEAPAFHEKAGMVSFSLGEHGITGHVSVEALRKGQNQPFILGGYAPMTLRMNGDTLLFSLKLWSASGQPPIEIENNEFAINISGWDWNYTANALEVVNAKAIPIFQMIRKSPYKILINGIISTPYGLIVASDKGCEMFDRQIPSDFFLQPIFKYPAWKYPGKYADGSN